MSRCLCHASINRPYIGGPNTTNFAWAMFDFFAAVTARLHGCVPCGSSSVLKLPFLKIRICRALLDEENKTRVLLEKENRRLILYY